MGFFSKVDDFFKDSAKKLTKTAGAVGTGFLTGGAPGAIAGGILSLKDNGKPAKSRKKHQPAKKLPTAKPVGMLGFLTNKWILIGGAGLLSVTGLYFFTKGK